MRDVQIPRIYTILLDKIFFAGFGHRAFWTSRVLVFDICGVCGFGISIFQAVFARFRNRVIWYIFSVFIRFLFIFKTFFCWVFPSVVIKLIKKYFPSLVKYLFLKSVDIRHKFLLQKKLQVHQNILVPQFFFSTKVTSLRKVLTQFQNFFLL